MGIAASFTRLSLIYDRLPLLPAPAPITVCSQQTYHYPVGFIVYEHRDHFWTDQEDFTVTDFNGVPLFIMAGQRTAFSLLDGLMVWGGQLFDVNGVPVAFLKPQTILGAPRGSYEIHPGTGTAGAPLAVVRGTHTFSGQRSFDIDVPGRGYPRMKVLSEWWDPNFGKCWLFFGDPTDRQAPPPLLMAKIDYGLSRWTVQVAPYVDITFVAAIVWCLDQFNELFVERHY